MLFCCYIQKIATQRVPEYTQETPTIERVYFLLRSSPFDSFVIFYFSPSDLWLADVSDKYKIDPCLGLSVGAKRKNGFLTLIPLLGPSSAGHLINTEQFVA